MKQTDENKFYKFVKWQRSVYGRTWKEKRKGRINVINL